MKLESEPTLDMNADQPSATTARTNRSDLGLVRLRHLIVNSYLIGEPGASDWVVLDAGIAASSARLIIRAAACRFGAGSKPRAIILTHGHFDHVGAAGALARRWNVPVFAHELELPYLTGRSTYPPPDPTVGGGLIARLAGLFPRRSINLRRRVEALPADGVVPGLVGWRWIHTPGHSPGHVSLFRLSDRVLIAGDAFVTVRQESMLAVWTQRRQVSRPPAFMTPDWNAAQHSVEALSALEPDLAFTGHGLPMAGERLREELRALVDHFRRAAVPARGRYVDQPAVSNDTGVVFVPPPVPDPVPKLVVASAAAIGLLAFLALAQHKRRSG